MNNSHTTKTPALLTGLSLYLAGKIAKHDWRHSVVDLRTASGDFYPAGARPWPVLDNTIFGLHHFTGPYFIACDHGCYHGEGAHGNGVDGEGCGSPGRTPYETIGRCFEAIDGSDALFAWLDCGTAYGTLVEIGYALGRGKAVVVATPPEYDLRDAGRDQWFAIKAADYWHRKAESPVEALRSVVAGGDPDGPLSLAVARARLRQRQAAARNAVQDGHFTARGGRR